METKQKNSKSGKKIWIIVAIAVVLALLIGSCTAFVFSDRFGAKKDSGELAKKLAAAGTDTIELTENVIVSEPLVVNGDKTITGSGKILLDTEVDAKWPDISNPSWGVGCPELEVEDTSKLPAVLTVSNGASLTISGTAGVNAEGKVNGIILNGTAKLTVKDEAIVENGRYANLVVGEKATLDIQGGSLLESNGYNVINYGTVTVSGGTIDGAKAGAALYNAGTATQTGGTISGAGMHNVYVASGTFTMSGGTNDGAGKDGILVAKDATANVTGGTISNCNHGMCNNGTLNTGKVTLSECGIMNFGTGTLTMQDTTVDTSEVYCLANNGGKVTATNFTAIGCDTCAVYNFSGDMELNNLTVKGGRDGNVATTGGNLTINGGVLDVCRDKSLVVGNGKAVLNNVAIKGTTNEKYGVYAFGGDLYINDSTIENVSSTAVKMDAGSVVNLKNVEIKDISQNGFQVDGGELHAENVTMTNMGSHGIYNKNGSVNGDGLTITGVKKNAVQHVGGTTTLNNVTASGTGNHGGYVADGTLTITNSSFADMKANGFYLIAGNNKLVLDNVKINGTGQQGINNNSVVEAKNVHISNTGMNGIYNKVGGVVTVSDSVIENVSEHGINNKATITITNVTVKNTGKDSNGIQNNGTMTVKKTSVTNSKKHGFYNTGKLNGENITVNGTGDNGVYNDHGNITINGLQISKAGTQGINNNGTIDVVNVKIDGTGKNGIYNSDGTAIVEKLTVIGTGEHGVNNVATMTLNGAVVSTTGEGKNGIQNSGTITITDAQVSDSKNHGIYNKGTFTAEKLSVSNTVGNGVYNDGGNAKITDLTVNNVGDQGVNNNSTIELVNVTISGTVKNGIYNSDGTAVVNGLTVDSTGEHGINNAAQMTASKINISNTGEGKNGLQNSGVLAVQDVTINQSKNHGIYNIGTLSGSEVTILGSADNGIYNYGGTIENLSNLTITDSVGQGVNNTGSFSASVIEISGAGKNGIYNNGGTANISGLLVEGVGEHGVSNQGTMLLSSSILNGSGKGSNCIQNKGELTLSEVTANGSANHGIYNDNVLISNGKLTINDAAVNGLYNYGGNVKLAEVEINAAGEHGINNTGTLEGEKILIDSVTANGFQNSGTLKVTGSALIIDSGKHGMYNSGTLEGTGITVTNAYDLLASNAGKMIVENLILNGTAHKALYNNGYAELYNATIDGALVTNGGNAEYLVDNNGGVLDLNDTTLVDAFGTSLHNRGNAVSSLTNVVIDGAGNYGIFVEGGSSLSGDGVVVNNVTKNEAVQKSEGYAIKNQGKITMMDHVTLGAYDDDVTGDGVTPRKENSGLYSTALTNDAASSTYSGYDLTIKNALGGNGIYNKGVLFVKDMVIDNVKDGLVNRYNSWATLSGDVSITNITRGPISNYGPESGSYVNGVTLVPGSTMYIENAGSHAINNKGSFLAAADTTLTIKNIAGKNINAINNQSNAIMTLGDVTIDGLYVTISMYNDTTINSNCGNGIQSNSALVINGKVVISNLFHKAENDKTDNSNGSGVVVKNGGKITGTGSITVIGNQTAPEGYEGYKGLFNGMFVTKCTVDIDGDIIISDSGNQGIYAADANASVSAGNITVTNAGGNGIYVNNASGKLTASGDINIDGASGGHGLSTNGVVTAVNVNVSNTTGSNRNGIEVKGGATLTVGGDITIIASGQRGLNNGGTVKATNLTIDGFGENGIQNSGTLNIADTITVNNCTKKGHGIYNSKTLTAGSVAISNVVRNGINNAGAFTVTGEVSVKNAGEGGIGSNKTFTAGSVTIDTVTAGPGLNNSGTMTITGLTTVKNITGKDVSAIQNKNTMTLGDVMIDGVYVEIGNDADNKQMTYVGNGINNTKKLTLKGTATITNVFTTAKNNTIGTGVAVPTDSVIDGSGNIVVIGTKSTNTTYPYGINNGIFIDASGTLNITGDITVSGVTNQGIYVANENAKLGAGNVTVKNVGGNGIYSNKTTGVVEVTGTISVDGTTSGHGLSTSGTTTAAQIVIKNSKKNGLEVKSGTLTVSGDITIMASAQRGLNNVGTVNAANVIIDGFGENGIQNGGTLNVAGQISISNGTGTGHGIYNSNTLTAGSFVVENVTRNGINNGGSFTVTGMVSVKNAVQGGIGSNKTFTAGSVTIDTVTAGPGLNNSGTMTITGLTSVKNITGKDVSAIQNKGTMTLGDVLVDGVYVEIGNDSEGAQMTNVGNGITNTKKLTLNGTATITNVFTTAKNNSIGAGVVVAPETTIDGSGSIVVIGTDTTNETYSHGINNGIFIDAGTLNIAGDISVSSVTNQGIYVANENAVLGANNITITNVNGNGIYVNKTTGVMNATGTVTINGTNNHGLSNSGTVTAAAMTITNIPKKNGLNNTGSVTVTGKLDVSTITAGYGVYSKAGSVQAGEMVITDIKGNIALFFEGEATIKAGTISISNVPKGQAIQLNHKNTFEVGTLIVQNCGKNALRIYNDSTNPTIKIETMVATDCAEYAVAAQKAITSDNLSIGTLWYTDCTKGAKHGNVKSGIGEVKNELPAATAAVEEV